MRAWNMRGIQRVFQITLSKVVLLSYEGKYSDQKASKGKILQERLHTRIMQALKFDRRYFLA